MSSYCVQQCLHFCSPVSRVLRSLSTDLFLLMYTSRTKAPIVATMDFQQHETLEHDSEKKTPYDKQWTLARFFFSWLACCLTPVCIGIVQAYDVSNPMVVLSIVCDIFFCFETIYVSGHLTRVSIILNRYGTILNKFFHSGDGLKSTIGGKASVSRVKDPVFFSSSPYASRTKTRDVTVVSGLILQRQGLLAPMLRSLLPLLLPVIAQLCGASDLLQAWLMLPRLLRLRDLVAIYHTLKNKFKDLAALHNDTINRCFMTAVFTSIYASSLSACWFYLSCRRQQQCSAEDDSNTWVGRDVVLREQNMFSVYIRSLHFIIQTLFTVGYGTFRDNKNCHTHCC